MNPLEEKVNAAVDEYLSHNPQEPGHIHRSRIYWHVMGSLGGDRTATPKQVKHLITAHMKSRGYTAISRQIVAVTYCKGSAA